MAIKDIFIPDLGVSNAEVIELLIAEGDHIELDQGILVLETDKASVEVPATTAGVVAVIHLAVGDQVTENSLCLSVETEGMEPKPTSTDIEAGSIEPTASSEASVSTSVAAVATDSTEAVEQGFRVPDLGVEKAEVIEVKVAVGESVEEGDTLAVIETDKAMVDIAAEVSGTLVKLSIAVGDTISTGDDLALIKTSQLKEAEPAPKVELKREPAVPPVPTSAAKIETQSALPDSTFTGIHAGPAVRQLARKLGVDLAKVKATGPRNRILQEDLHLYVADLLATESKGGGLPPLPVVDYASFGEISSSKRSRMHKAIASNMLRSWLNVPHVTQFDDADVTDLEAYRSSLKPLMQEKNIKVTPVTFLIKAVAITLLNNPRFNTAVDTDDQIIRRHYIHIGLAVATQKGLLVPVIRDADKKTIWELAKEITRLSASAREGKLSPRDMQGGCFTVSSLGAIGGNGFTPIVNTPEVAILGASKTRVMPHWDGSQFVPRTMLPLSLSYDHCAINGADAGKFLTELIASLADVSCF